VTADGEAAKRAADDTLLTGGSAAAGSRDRPRVLIVVTLAETGGAQTYVRNLLPMLVAEFDVVVAAHGDGALREAARSAGAAYVPLIHVRRRLGLFRDLAGLIELWLLCRRIRPDLVHLNSSKAGILGAVAAALAGVRIRMFTAHGWAFKTDVGFHAAVYRTLHRAIRPLLTCVVCVSRSELSIGLAAGACSSARSELIPNGVLQRPDAGGSRDGIVTVTRLRAPKDILTLVDAVVRHGGALPHVTVVGDGPDRGRVEHELATAGFEDRIELVGDVEDPGPFLDRASLFVLSSRSEGLPMAVLEAMAAGLPVVATAVGGVPEVVQDGVTGALVPPGDAVSMGAALLDLASDPARARAWGASGRRLINEKYGIERCQQAHQDLYRRLLQLRS
jgi:glycosyltransferase involved in cell wall biosynthesis